MIISLRNLLINVVAIAITASGKMRVIVKRINALINPKNFYWNFAADHSQLHGGLLGRHKHHSVENNAYGEGKRTQKSMI